MGAHMRWQGSHLRMVVSSESLTSLVRWQEKFILPDYMEKQPDISGDMRAILVDWMVEVQVWGHGHGLLQHSPHLGCPCGTPVCWQRLLQLSPVQSWSCCSPGCACAHIPSSERSPWEGSWLSRAWLLPDTLSPAHILAGEL